LISKGHPDLAISKGTVIEDYISGTTEDDTNYGL